MSSVVSSTCPFWIEIRSDLGPNCYQQTTKLVAGKERVNLSVACWEIFHDFCPSTIIANSLNTDHQTNPSGAF